MGVTQRRRNQDRRSRGAAVRAAALSDMKSRREKAKRNQLDLKNRLEEGDDGAGVSEEQRRVSETHRARSNRRENFKKIAASRRSVADDFSSEWSSGSGDSSSSMSRSSGKSGSGDGSSYDTESSGTEEQSSEESAVVGVHGGFEKNVQTRVTASQEDERGLFTAAQSITEVFYLVWFICY